MFKIYMYHEEGLYIIKIYLNYEESQLMFKIDMYLEEDLYVIKIYIHYEDLHNFKIYIYLEESP